MQAFDKGIWGEALAGLLMLVKGYRILARRYKTKVGEIDLICRKGRCLIFVEVKAYRDVTAGFYNITPRQQQRIIRSAGWYLASAACRRLGDNPDCRFDVVIVRWQWQSFPFMVKVHHLKNAFETNF